ncbi:MAG: hypothetical protein CM1200mP36_03150 [Gammaproteobacteria bacterium]|nr:MAG: hypothetical protein CM1200mP36_03150 [Gammaproteobacteria bacterium]
MGLAPRSFGYQLLKLLACILKIPSRNHGVATCPNRTHAAVGLVRTALVKLNFPPGTLQSQRTDFQSSRNEHRRYRLRNVPRVANTTIRNDRNSVSVSAEETSATAGNCGTPTPAITRVVQIDPGPIPTLTASAPAPTKGARPRPLRYCPQSAGYPNGPL